MNLYKPYRQGDILFVPIDETDEKEIKMTDEVHEEGGRLVVASGEATGHHHAFYGDNLHRNVQLFQTVVLGMALLKLRETMTIKHEEHESITLPPGAYLVKRPFEYISEDEKRVVAD